MSDQLKFRAWDDVNDIMIPNVQAGICEKHDTETISFGDVLKNPRFHVMRYAGISDKNGIECYEGDIIRFHVYYYEKLITTTVSDVKWCEELCALSFIVNKQGTRGTLGHLLDSNKEFEIIGNIYENPELLQSMEVT